MQKSFILIGFLILGLASANYWQITKEFKQDNFGSADLDSWTVNGLNQPYVGYCERSWVGGPGIAAKGSISKRFQSPVPLNNLIIMVDIGLFDNWRSGWEGGKNQNQLRIYVNDQNVFQIGSDETRQLHSQSQNVCGGSAKDRFTRASFTVPMDGSQSFNFRISGDFEDGSNPSDVSWGIRDLYIMTEIHPKQQQLVVNEISQSNNYDVSLWNTNFGGATSNCGGSTILGGYGLSGSGAQFSRQLSNLKPHSFLTIEFDAYIIDSFDANDTVVISVDGAVVHEWSRQFKDSDSNVCGVPGWNDNVQHVRIHVAHFSPNAKISIYVNVDQGAGDESFGFNNFSVHSAMPCPIIYSDYEARGQLLSFCGSIPNLRQVGWNYPIKGIYIPDGYKLTLFRNSKYHGVGHKFRKTDLHLEGDQYAMINKAFKIRDY